MTPAGRSIRNCSLMFRIATSAAVVLVNTAAACPASTTECAQATELAAARVRWGIRTFNSPDAAYKQEACRAYSKYFYEAVTTRQAISICGQGPARKRDLDIVDSEIETANNPITTHSAATTPPYPPPQPPPP